MSALGWWIVKGNLNYSLTLGTLPLADPLVMLQSLVTGHVPERNAIIGVCIVLAFYLLVGGRVYCAWVCPVNVVTDSAAWLRRRLRPETETEIEATFWESLDQMVSRMDVISINCPHTPSTFHLMNARRLKLLKPSAVIVNTSRGEVIDENALTRMLRAGEIAGAGLDVYERGAEINPRLRELPNAVLLPHMGSATIEGRIEMGEKVILNIKTFADGHRPPDQVLPGML